MTLPPPASASAKPAWASKTMWGGMFIGLSLLLEQFGIEVDPDSAADEWVALIELVMQLVGLVLVFVGRFSATRPVTLTGKASPPSTPTIALLLATTGLLGGCNAPPGGAAIYSPETRWTMALASVTDVQERLMAAHDRREIGDPNLVDGLRAAERALEHLADARGELPLGGPQFEHFLMAAQEATLVARSYLPGADGLISPTTRLPIPDPWSSDHVPDPRSAQAA